MRYKYYEIICDKYVIGVCSSNVILTCGIYLIFDILPKAVTLSSLTAWSRVSSSPLELERTKK